MAHAHALVVVASLQQSEDSVAPLMSCSWHEVLSVGAGGGVSQYRHVEMRALILHVE